MDQKDRFLAAFEDYADGLFRHSSFRIRDRDQAIDLVHETFAKTWDYISKGNAVEDFKPFLYRTLNNLIIDTYRKKPTESLDSMLEEGSVPEGSFDELREGGLEEMANRLDAGRVLEILPEMPEHYRNVIVLRYVDGLLPQEIAEITGESVNVVSVRIHRGIGWLRKRIDR